MSTTPRTYMAAAVSFERLMQESEQLETELSVANARVLEFEKLLKIQSHEHGCRVAELEKQRDDLGKALTRMICRGNNLNAELSASQQREAVLREALELFDLGIGFGVTAEMYDKRKSALSATTGSGFLRLDEADGFISI